MTVSAEYQSKKREHVVAHLWKYGSSANLNRDCPRNKLQERRNNCWSTGQRKNLLRFRLQKNITLENMEVEISESPRGPM